MTLHIISFTRGGAALAWQLAADLPNVAAYAPERFAGDAVQPLTESLDEWTKKRFCKSDALLFIGATGIAVRAIAPYVRDKTTDPAVLTMDERGRHCIPLLSGHIGGANALAKRIAAICGAQAVLSTATDLNGLFAVDEWAAENGYHIHNPPMIKRIAAALLEYQPVGFASDYPVTTPLPEGVTATHDADCGIRIATAHADVYPHTLTLMPRLYTVGIGCRCGVSFQALERLVLDVLADHDIPPALVGVLASIELKRDENAIIELSHAFNAKFAVFSAEQLGSLSGNFSASGFVRQTVGVDNVCERAAVYASGASDTIIARKTTRDGVAVAVAKKEWSVAF